MGEETPAPRRDRDPLIPRPVITLIALVVTAAMIGNVWRGGESMQTLILAGVVCSTFGFGWILDWVSRR